MKKIIWLCLCAMLCLSLVPATALAQNTDAYVHEKQFSGDHQLTGLFSSFTEGFYTGDWDIHEAVLKLNLMATPLLIEQVSDFTVSLNGQRFHSGRIPVTQGEVTELTIELPLRAVKQGFNTLEFETYIRTNPTNPCSDDIATASWMTVLADSCFSISYTPKGKCDNIAEFYARITSIDALENGLSSVMIVKDAEEADFGAAALALAGLSKNAQLGYDNLALEQTNTMPAGKKFIVCVAQYSQLTPALSGLLNAQQKTLAETGHCVMVLSEVSADIQLLLLTGDEDALLKGGSALINASYMAQIQSEWTSIAPAEDVLIKRDQTAETVTLAPNGSYVKGPFRQTAMFSIANPPNRQVMAGSEVALDFRYAENLDFNRSMVTVYINDKPIGSKKLTKTRAQSDFVRFPLPENLQITGAFTLELAFDLEIPDLYCTERQNEMPWAFVTSESTVTLYTKNAENLLFENYPAPFVYNGQLNNIAIVLPPVPSGADIESLRRLMVTMGRFVTDNGGKLNVMFASGIGDLTQSSIIAIGRYDLNPIAKQLNSELYFQFSNNGSTILSNEKMTIEPVYGEALGTAQLLYSPYSSEDKALLIISGANNESVLFAASYLGKVENLWKIYGDGFVADNESSYSYRFKSDNAIKLSFWEQLLSRKDLLIMGIACVVVVLILIFVLMTLHIRNKRKKQNG